jgi:hypothetical protein
MGQPAPLAVTVASDLALEVVLGGTFLLDDLVDPNGWKRWPTC